MRWPLGIKMMVGLLLLLAPVETWAQGGAIDRYAAGSKRNPRAGSLGIQCPNGTHPSS
jgi:hypothetical protein